MSDQPQEKALQGALLKLETVSKSFGGVQALKNVDFALGRGEVHALVGENGAGKSTAMKIIAGVHTEYDGQMSINGEVVRFASPRDALNHGIGMVHQELSTVPDLTVAENVFLGAQPVTKLGRIDWRAMNEGAAKLLSRLGLDLDPRGRLGDLPIGLQQLIELARVLFSGASIIILDEPTSALSPPEIKTLFDILDRLKREEGRSFIFISHFLEDVLEISDRVTVFRNGEKVAEAAAGDIDKRWIIQRMIGLGHNELEETYTAAVGLKSVDAQKPTLEIRDLTRLPDFENISFTVSPGEILGIYGFMGCGQLALARALFGQLRAKSGTISIDGEAKRFANTSTAKNAGMAFVPESRRSMLFADQPVYRNMSISVLEHIDRLWLKPAAERELATRHVADLGVRPANIEAPLRTLSGGNQQKVALGRWMTELPRILVMCEPTRGMDVGAKEDVVRIVLELAAKGVGVIIVSTEPETVLTMANRVLVMRKGRITHEFANTAIAKDDLLAAA